MAAHHANQALFDHVQQKLCSSNAPDDTVALNDVLDSLRRFPAAIYTKPHFELLLGACDLSTACKSAVTAKLPKRGKKRQRSQPNNATSEVSGVTARSTVAAGEVPFVPAPAARAPGGVAVGSSKAAGRPTRSVGANLAEPTSSSGGKPPTWGIFADTAAGVKRTGACAGEGINVSADNWEVVLLLDTREVKSRGDRDYLGSHLRSKGVTVETRQLPLGDMLWVARPKSVPGVRLRAPAPVSQRGGAQDEEDGSEAALAVSKSMWPHEWLLSVIVERKRVSDLSASILDGRYEEQKRRLLACPCQRVVYVIEGDLARRDVLTSKGLTSSIASTTVHSGFLVQRTSSVDGSIDFLASMHDALRASFLPTGAMGASMPLLQCPCLPSPPLTYSSFVVQCAKPVATTALQLFGMQLRQIKGMSAPRAETVLERFATPYALHCELKRLAGMETGIAAASQRGSQVGTGTVPVTSVAANNMFAKVHVPGQKSVFGGKLSERLAAFYGQGAYDDVVLS